MKYKIYFSPQRARNHCQLKECVGLCFITTSDNCRTLLSKVASVLTKKTTQILQYPKLNIKIIWHWQKFCVLLCGMNLLKVGICVCVCVYLCKCLQTN